MNKILEGLTVDGHDIYSYRFTNTEQSEEINLRRAVASQVYDSYPDVLSQNHSIPVMEKEVRLFLKKIPPNGVIIDVGGSWGWHWRHLKDIRPDVKVAIVDFVKENFVHAANILKESINENIFLIHGDATSLIFNDNTFDGYWSVQTLQHIPNFTKAIEEAYRVLKPNGVFASYSLNTDLLIQWLCRLLGKSYHIEGDTGSFYLSRASHKQKNILGNIFCSPIDIRFSEILFKPEFGLTFTGREGSIVGKIDSMFSGNIFFTSFIARQQSFHTIK